MFQQFKTFCQRHFAFYDHCAIAGYRLAICRNSGNASEVATLTALMPDASLSRQAMATWENRLSANLLLQPHEYFHARYEAVAKLRALIAPCMDSIPEGRSLTYEILRIQGDGTNSAIAHGHKAHTCQVRACFELNIRRHWPDPSCCPELTELGEDLEALTFLPDQWHVIWPDLLPIPERNTGPTQQMLYKTQVESTGASWLSEQGWDVRGSQNRRCTHIRVLIFGSDQGPDQKSCSKMIAEALPYQVYVLPLLIKCIETKHTTYTFQLKFGGTRL